MHCSIRGCKNASSGAASGVDFRAAVLGKTLLLPLASHPRRCQDMHPCGLKKHCRIRRHVNVKTCMRVAVRGILVCRCAEMPLCGLLLRVLQCRTSALRAAFSNMHPYDRSWDFRLMSGHASVAVHRYHHVPAHPETDSPPKSRPSFKCTLANPTLPKRTQTPSRGAAARPTDIDLA